MWILRDGDERYTQNLPPVRLAAAGFMKYPGMGACDIWSGTNITTITRRQDPNFLTANWGDFPARRFGHVDMGSCLREDHSVE